MNVHRHHLVPVQALGDPFPLELCTTGACRHMEVRLPGLGRVATGDLVRYPAPPWTLDTPDDGATERVGVFVTYDVETRFARVIDPDQGEAYVVWTLLRRL